MYTKFFTSMLVACLTIQSSISFASAKGDLATKRPRLSVNMGEGCAMSVADTLGGHLASGMPLNASYWTDRPPVKTQIDGFAVNFVCEHVINEWKEQIANQHGGTYDTKKSNGLRTTTAQAIEKLLLR